MESGDGEEIFTKMNVTTYPRTVSQLNVYEMLVLEKSHMTQNSRVKMCWNLKRLLWRGRL